VPEIEFPGVFVQEVPNGVHSIEGVSTSTTAFIGRALRGEVNQPIAITCFDEFELVFGSRYARSALGFAISDFFENGGSTAVVVRIFKPEGPAADQDGCSRVALPGTGELREPLVLKAKSPGEWGNSLLVNIRYPFSSVEDSARASTRRATIAAKLNLPLEDVASQVFNIRIHEKGSGISEEFLGLTICNSNRRIDDVLCAESKLVEVAGRLPQDPPRGDAARGDQHEFSGGSEGSQLNGGTVIGSEADKTGIYAFEKTDLFNLLCIPPYAGSDVAELADVDGAVWEAALTLCEKRRAMLIVDSPWTWKTAQDAADGFKRFHVRRSANAAIYYPRIMQLNSLRNVAGEFAPSGAIAGIIARIDAAKGVWTAPAGTHATILGIADLSTHLTEPDNAILNALGINCLRTFPGAGMVVWGARTTRGADVMNDEYKYVPVRRTALFIEESLYRGLQWTVFEPNDEAMWSKVRLTAGSFMHNLFLRGAFQGETSEEAYFVKCNRTTMTQSDLDNGTLNVEVGFAPLKPAEFVILRFSIRARKSDD
jgi:uncharacterized protein